MKKYIAMLLATFMLFGTSACANTNSENTPKQTEQQEQQEEAKKEEKIDISKMSDEEIINQFVEAGFPISKMIVYNEETDVNEVLGRPNQYIQKTNFADSRYEQYNIEEDPIGGTIEIFNNKKDAQSRYDYLESVYEILGYKDYMYLRDNMLFRIHHQLTPTHAGEYEKAFDDIIDGKKPTYTPSETEKTEEVKEVVSDNGMVDETCTVAIKDCFLTTNNDGKDVIVVNFDFSNSGDKGISFSSIIDTKAFQDGIELTKSFHMYKNPQFNDDNNSKEVKQGATLGTQIAYEVYNTDSPVEVEVSSYLGTDEQTLKKIFNLKQ